jgi:hypothetical protein
MHDEDLKILMIPMMFSVTELGDISTNMSIVIVVKNPMFNSFLEDTR